MCLIFAAVAGSGVQVIAETHSVHLHNGVRRFVKDTRIEPDRVALHFFTPRKSDMPQVISPMLDRTGGIDSWPAGFFDQFDKDTNYFAGWGK
jgi:predicted ATPase